MPPRQGPRFRRQGDLLDARGGRGRGARAGGARRPPAASLHLRALPAGHFHLTTDLLHRPAHRQHLPLHLRIPQQPPPAASGPEADHGHPAPRTERSPRWQGWFGSTRRRDQETSACRSTPAPARPAQPEDLVDVDALLAAYHDRTRTPTTRRSGSRSAPPGTAARRCKTTFNDDHIAATSQAICEYRAAQGTDGPLFLGRDTHALSEPAWITAIEVFAANGVHGAGRRGRRLHPDPRACRTRSCTHNRGRTGGLADGVVVTPSHNPPPDGGFKYNPPNGGPADTDATDVDRRPGQRAAGARSSTGSARRRSTGAASSAATTSSASTSPTCPPCWTWTRSATPGCASAPTRSAGPAWPTGGRSPSGTGSTSPWSTRTSTRSSGS